MTQQKVKLTQIAVDTRKGLSSTPKCLLSKYFYDDEGSRIFQKIMQMPEYYLTNCEHEIFVEQKEDIIKAIDPQQDGFELIELGAGDGLKTSVLLEYTLSKNTPLIYVPIDISPAANQLLKQELADKLPELKVKPVNGDYFMELKAVNGSSELPKVIFFLGANIGNFNNAEMDRFFNNMAGFTSSGDKLLIGFDLKKDPDIIKNAYDDPHGHTSRFNLNHLKRLNRELGANFDLDKYKQQTVYDPASGFVKSYLVVLEDQEVIIDALEQTFHFRKWETIYMELSRKFDQAMIQNMAEKYGFKVQQNFFDQREFFVDSLWVKL